MGAEVTCHVTVAGGAGEARVLLETDELIVRASPPLRRRIPFASITSLDVAGGRLTVHHGAESTEIELGSRAEQWAEKIRSPKSLLDKLGIKADAVVSVVGVADEAFLEQLSARTAHVTRGRVRVGSAAIFVGVERERDLARIASAAPKLADRGAIWVVHRKGPAGVPDTVIFGAARAAGLTYTKVVRFSATHTAERLSVSKPAR